MQNRIDRLEGLVLSLMTNGSQSAGPTAATRALSFSSPSSGSAASPQNVDLDGDDMIKDENEDGESETDQVSKSLGMMKVENNRSMYFGEAHWAAILNDVSEHARIFLRYHLLISSRLRKSKVTLRITKSSMKLKC